MGAEPVAVLYASISVLNFAVTGSQFRIRIKMSFILARYVYTYEEFVIVTEAPQCNRMTVTGEDTVNKRTMYKMAETQYTIQTIMCEVV